MAFDLIPRRLLSFPTLPSFWDEDEDWLTMPSTQTGLSVSEDEKNVYVEAALPGIDPKNIEVTYQDGYVWIHGEVKEEEKDKKRKYYRQSAQSFSYRVAVPGDIDPNSEPEATYKHGMMIVAFAKSSASQPKKIKIKGIDDEQKQLK
ncbi:MAG: Hsp20/alpha crystallin family protein [Candidatus Pacearchaeota archaeon]